MAQFNVPFITDEQLRKRAESYLANQHPSGELPIPIEEIVDLKERIDIIPVQDLGEQGHVAFLSRDCKTIYVDKAVHASTNTNRYRFTLAHELAHMILHGGVFKAADYTDIAGYRAFLKQLRDDVLTRIEAQAYKLGGLLLVPTADLSREYSAMGARLASEGMDIAALPPVALKHVAKKMGDTFGVSFSVIHRRAVREGLWAWDAIPEA